MKEIVLSTSSLNSYGFRVLTEGIDTEQYVRNPILLWNHNRPFLETKDVILPIGKIENLRVDGDRLIGTPVFDEGDEFAREIKRKFEGGFISMASVGLDIVELSEEPQYLVQGQTRATVTRSKLVEVSLTDIGANDEALVLYNESGQVVELSKDGDHSIIPRLNLSNKKIDKMEDVKVKLGLPNDADKSMVLLAIDKLQEASKKVSELEKELAEKKRVVVLSEVDRAVALKKITADKKEHFVALGEQVGFETLKATFEAMSSATKPSDIIGGGKATATATEGKKWAELTAEERVALRAEDVENYKKLYREHYGVDCDIE